jgi:uncharacterized protein
MMEIIDCHSHWATEKGYIFRTKEELENQEKIWRTPVKYFTEDEQADYFRKSNARVILDMSFTKFLPVEDMRAHHDYALAFQRKNPDVVLGHWLQFDPKRAEESIKEFRRCVDAKLGFIGFCVNGQVTGVPASDPLWAPFYKTSIDADLPVMILTGLTGIGQNTRGGLGIVLDDGHPRHIDAVAAKFPELNILAARPGYPWQDEMIAVMRHKKNVFYELHGWGPRQFDASLKKEIRGRLQDRIMFGCDFPVLRYEKVVADWQSECYAEEVLNKVFHENAKAYFSFS